MTILVTGAAGFIGFHVAQALLAQGQKIIGIDNLNNYYDVRLKEARLGQLAPHPHFTFYKGDIAYSNTLDTLKANHADITKVVHLAAQPGVRYSIDHPMTYAHSNLVGHLTILELCRHLPTLERLVYASSSSVYGGNTKLPFSINDPVDKPISLYAATKKADELMSYCYSHLYHIPMTGLRFFTVYGPWGRPDMATYGFTQSIIAGKPIKVFNHGDMKRDFTYIDDIVSGVIASLNQKSGQKEDAPHKVYNLGNNKSEPLMRFIEVLEQAIGKKAVIDFQPLQDGDVKETYADITETTRDLGFVPTTSIDEGLPKFVEWYRRWNLA